MDNKKNYYNEELSQILKIYLTEKRYGEFAPLLEEIFQRRAYEFEIHERVIEEEVQNFIKNVESIRFVTSEEIGKDTYRGLYRPRNKEILLNRDLFLDSTKTPEQLAEELFETLTHEVYHGMNDYYEKYGETGIVYYKENGERMGNALDETFVEVAADRTVFSRNLKEREDYISKTYSYSDITFAPNLLATSLGLTEKETIGEGGKNRWALLDALKSKFSSYEAVEKAEKEFLEPFEQSLDVIYNILYDEAEEPKDMKKILLVGALKSLYSNAYELFNFQIQDETGKITNSYASEVIFRMKKIEKILEGSLKSFKDDGILLFREAKEIKDSLASQRRKLVLKAAGISIMAEYGEKLEAEEYEKLSSEVREGKLQNIRSILRQKYGVNVPEISLAKMMEKDDSEYRDYIIQEDFDNGLQWDNTEVLKIMSGVLRRNITDRPKEDIVNAEENINGNNTSSKVQINFASQTTSHSKGKNLLLKDTTQDKLKEKNWFLNFLKKIKGLIFKKDDVKLLDEPKNISKVVVPTNNFGKYVVTEENLQPLEMGKGENTTVVKSERDEK